MIQSIIGTSFTGGGGTPPPPSQPTFVANNYSPLEGTTITFTISGITGVSEGTFLYWWIDGTSPSYSRANQFVENIDNSVIQIYTDGSGKLGGTFNLTPNTGGISFNIYIGYNLYGGFLNLSSDVYVNLPNNNFTVEWWQKMTSSVSSYDRLFVVGDNPNESIGFSEELQGNILAVWTDGSLDYIFSNISSLYNTWVHFAIVRNNNTLALYYNGTRVFNVNSSRIIEDNTSSLQIGGGSNQKFNGYLTNFHFLKGVAKYNGNFTPSTTPLNPTIYTETKLLLSVTSSNTAFIDSTGGHTASIIGGTWSSQSPFSDGSGSIYFDGVSTYLYFPASNDWAIDL
jgi:hypothetical protein